MKATVLYGSAGYYVEFYRDDDNDSGYGDNPRRACWYGDRADCHRLADASSPPAGLQWTKIDGWQPDMSPGSAAWCESYGDAA